MCGGQHCWQGSFRSVRLEEMALYLVSGTTTKLVNFRAGFTTFRVYGVCADAVVIGVLFVRLHFFLMFSLSLHQLIIL